MGPLPTDVKEQIKQDLKIKLLNAKNFSEDMEVKKEDKAYTKKIQRTIARGYRRFYKGNGHIYNRVSAIIHRLISQAIKI